MAKKKKLSSGEVRARTMRRFQRALLKLLLVAGLGLTAVMLYKPGMIENTEQRQKVEEVRGKLVESGGGGGVKLVSAVDSAKNYIEHAFETVKLPKNLSGGEEEIVVQELVDGWSEEIKHLPAEQVKKVKVKFCQDVINEATQSGNEVE